MYDELLKRLRERSVFLFPHHGESRSYDADLMHEAADAIEELLKKMQQFHRWIPLTELLPEEMETVIDCRPHVKETIEYTAHHPGE